MLSTKSSSVFVTRLDIIRRQMRVIGMEEACEPERHRSHTALSRRRRHDPSEICVSSLERDNIAVKEDNFEASTTRSNPTMRTIVLDSRLKEQRLARFG